MRVPSAMCAKSKAWVALNAQFFLAHFNWLTALWLPLWIYLFLTFKKFSKEEQEENRAQLLHEAEEEAKNGGSSVLHEEGDDMEEKQQEKM